MKLYEIKNGLLQFGKKIPEPHFWENYNFKMRLYGIQSKIDHIVLCFDTKTKLKSYLLDLLACNGIQTEKFGIFPNDFCQELNDFPDHLRMYFTGIRINTGLLILISSVKKGDQLDSFLQERTSLGIHHIAFRANNLDNAIKKWSKKKFKQLSNPFTDENYSQVFLKNKSGQIIELIKRHSKSNKTLSCNNISGLRRSEFKQQQPTKGLPQGWRT